MTTALKTDSSPSPDLSSDDLNLMAVKTALVSVSDKSGLPELAEALTARGVNILSTGGTAHALRELGAEVTDVSDVTQFPEMMDGRVKTLHPNIHGGILADRSKESHVQAAASHDIGLIDLVVINLYPFESDESVAQIDIGGPAMVRAAAKNHAGVAVVTDPSQYGSLLAELDAHNGATCLEYRCKLAQAAFTRTAFYDLGIASWMAEASGLGLRYGENPHQKACVLKDLRAGVSVIGATQVQGKALSYNNINDGDAAFELVSEFTDRPTIAIIKHANPCGVAEGTTLVEAWDKALACDPVSAFGGIVAMNQKLTPDLAEKLVDLFLEVVIAPEIDPAAADILAVKKNLRVLETGGMPDPKTGRRIAKSIAGGMLVQSRDNVVSDKAGLQVVTDATPTEAQIQDLLFAEKVAKHVKSNTIVYAKNGATLGIGAGQMSRLDSAKIAAAKAEEFGLDLSGCVAASDAFFPFSDALEVLVHAGATAILQPGGSIKDDDVIATANELGVSMVLTGTRHFKH